MATATMATTTGSGMNARDYQHKRFRNHSNSPRVVTPSGRSVSSDVVVVGEQVPLGKSGSSPTIMPQVARLEPARTPVSNQRSRRDEDDPDSDQDDDVVNLAVLPPAVIRRSKVPLRIDISEQRPRSTSSFSTIGMAQDNSSTPISQLSEESGSFHTSSSRTSTSTNEQRNMNKPWLNDHHHMNNSSMNNRLMDDYEDDDYESEIKPESKSTILTNESVIAARSPSSVASNSENRKFFIHQPTAKGQTLMGTSPLSKSSIANQHQTSEIRYSLSDGRKSMTDAMYKRSQDVVETAAAQQTQSRLRAIHSLALQQPESSGHTRSSRRSRSSTGSASVDTFKIFMLLLQPKSKIFELIQIVYSPQYATIGDLLNMIPDNATETALGTQKYIGLCRPKTKEEILDSDLLASESLDAVSAPFVKEVPTAKITLGEILVAIPEGYSGEVVSALSKHILANPKIVKLLKRSDPLAPKSKRSSKRSSRITKRHSRSRRSQRKSLEILDKHDEEDEIKQEKMERKMEEAMAHAAMEAAAANAAIPADSDHKSANSDQEPVTDDSKSLTDLSTQDSIDESYSSWSKSFEQSFSAQSSVCSGFSNAGRSVRRKDRNARRIVILQRMSAVAFVLMIVLYFLDPRGYASKAENIPVETAQTPMGIMGIFQCMFLLLVLYKVERLARRTALTESNMPPPQCPFLRASANAMDTLRNKYHNKMKRQQKQPHTNASTPPRRRPRRMQHQEETASLHHRLREFSIQASGDSSSLRQSKQYY